MFLLRTHALVEQATADLMPKDLYNNIEAARITLRCLLDDLDPNMCDTAYSFNTYCWRGHSLSLMAYAAHMCRAYMSVSDAHVASISMVKETMYDLDIWMDVFAEELSEKMDSPAWVGNDEVHTAHKAYLMWKDSDYAARFHLPYLIATPLPVTDSGLAVYAQ